MRKFGTPTEPQEAGLAAHCRRTHHAHLRADGFRQNACGVSGLHRPLGAQGAGWRSARCTEVLYVSPLKALGNDIQKNLEASA